MSAFTKASDIFNPLHRRTTQAQEIQLERACWCTCRPSSSTVSRREALSEPKSRGSAEAFSYRYVDMGLGESCSYCRIYRLFLPYLELLPTVFPKDCYLPLYQIFRRLLLEMIISQYFEDLRQLFKYIEVLRGFYCLLEWREAEI